MTEISWVSVSGFGAHIKSTQKNLIIKKQHTSEIYPLENVSNFLIIGGHTISSSTITQLVKNGTFITFFDPDGTPVGSIKPFDNGASEENLHFQQNLPRQRYAVAFAQASIKSRLFTLQHIQGLQNNSLFYEGELDFLMKLLEELDYLIKLDEIRRLHRLASDMYYEILSRNIQPDLGFRRRTRRPHADPVNVMLSLSYGFLFGNCCAAVTGARLNADLGLLHEGKGSLVYDLIDPLKASLIDPAVLEIAKNTLTTSDYEITDDRCMVSDAVITSLIKTVYDEKISEKINEQVALFLSSLTDHKEIKILY